MNEKTKTLTIIVVAVLACLLIYSPITEATQTNIDLADDITIAEPNEFKTSRFRVRPKTKFAIWFLKHAEQTQVEGTVVALSKKKLILNTFDDQIRVNLPIEWTVENQVITLQTLYENYLIESESVTIMVLRADLITKEGLHISILVGYEIITDLGYQAIANLKVNIED